MLNITNFAKARRYLNINLIAREAGIDVQTLFEKLAAEESLQPAEEARLIHILSEAGIQLRTREHNDQAPMTDKSVWADKLKALPLRVAPQATLHRDFFCRE